MSQLLLTAKDGYSFSGATGGPVTAAVPQQRGSHGYLASDPDMDALFIASGYGVRAGALSGADFQPRRGPHHREAAGSAAALRERQAPAAPVIV